MPQHKSIIALRAVVLAPIKVDSLHFSSEVLNSYKKDTDV